MKLLVFDIFGDFAHFRRYYTTSSALSFSFPPPPTIRGMIGAILGLPKETHKKEAEDFYVGCSILTKQRKTRMTFNQRIIRDFKYEIKAGKPTRTQTRIEFLRNPKFRIYVMSNDKKMDTLIERVKKHETCYTLSLGLAECFADFKYIDDIKVADENTNNTKQAKIIKECQIIHSIIPLSIINNFSPEENPPILKENSVPIRMLDDRIVAMYEDIVYSMEPLKGQFINQNDKGKIVQYEDDGETKNVYLWA